MIDNPALSSFIMALTDLNASVRENALRSIGNMRDGAEDAVPYILRCLEDDDEDVLYWAIWSLGRIGPGAEIAGPAVESFKTHKNPKIVEATVDALDRILGRYKEGQWRV
ncbi:MAG: HEAT repeat domain-containing protein [Planctomycetota bacterium]|nr:HEAT repeat domain-containing protein [Planctomycetota bacterium]